MTGNWKQCLTDGRGGLDGWMACARISISINFALSADRPVISSKELRQYQSEVDKQAQKFFKKGAGTATPGDGFGMSAAAAETSFDVFASHDRPIPHGAVIRTVWFGGNEGRDSEPTYYMMSMPQFSPEVLPGLIKMSLVPMQVVTNKIPIEVKSSAGYKKNQKKMPEFLSPTQAASYAYRQPSSDEYYEYDNAYYEGTNEIYDDGGDSSKYTEPKKLMSYPGPMPEFITASERPASSPAHRPPVYTRPGGKGNDAKAQLYYDDFPEENENETGRQIVSEAKVNSYYYKPFSDSPSRRRSGNRFYYRYPKSQPQSHPSMSVHFR